MLVRHLTAVDNLDQDGFLIDPLAVAHGLIVGGRVAALGGPVDPTTHLNRDFAEHDLDHCAVVARLEVGAEAMTTADGLLFAAARDQAYRSRGAVDLSARRAAWRAALAARRAAR